MKKIKVTAFTLLIIIASEASSTVRDICGNTYDTVRIGTQVWLKENMRCNKYDTKSEHKGEVLSISISETYAPYYTDPRNSGDKPAYMDEEHWNSLGLLYSWAAAMGYADETAANAQSGEYRGTRQGICPNGWHVPSLAEFHTLASVAQEAYDDSGKHLKSTSGWFYRGSGDNSTGFSGLPAGYAYGSGSVYAVGKWGCFWSTDAYSSDYAYYRHLTYCVSGLNKNAYTKYIALSVRCIKD